MVKTILAVIEQSEVRPLSSITVRSQTITDKSVLPKIRLTLIIWQNNLW